MKSFEELEEVVHSINEMEQIFKGIAIIACHEKEIQRYTELKDRTFEILVQDIHRNEALCSEPLVECVTCETCRKACKEVLDIINSYSHIPAQFEACKILQQAIRKTAERRSEMNIEDFKPAEEIERLQSINADLLEACKKAFAFFPYWYEPETKNFLKMAIVKADEKEE